ncbi:hypothetical protein C4577_07750 [Candidatus Parcubacteria bacterium]|nr:MAG: hypothetical protein C4577_07750 [Candidatus Parcubacteria bacterium]
MAISPQSQSLYLALLNSSKPLSAQEIASKLHIFPNSVYRLTTELTQIGLITKSDQYPYKFSAKPVNEGLSLFLLYQNVWFSQKFSNFKKRVVEKEKIPPSQQINLSFIQSRDQLMKESEIDVAKATRSIDLLRSGHEIPADLMFEMIKAKNRNVVTRMLIQDYSKENANMVTNWQKNGILVRKTTLLHLRLMIYDSSIVYFTSYKHANSQKDMGMKINYPPFAVILSQLFEEWWQKAETI